jgi:hypothetical protein
MYASLVCVIKIYKKFGGGMMQNIKVSHIKSADQLVRMRAFMLLFAAFSFGLWQYTWIARDIISEPSLLSYQIVGWACVVGSVCWAVTTFLFIKFNRDMKRSGACDALHDELVVTNRNCAFFNSYILLFALVWLLIPVLDFWPFDAIYAVRAIAATAVILPMVLFAHLEMKNDQGAE